MKFLVKQIETQRTASIYNPSPQKQKASWSCEAKKENQRPSVRKGAKPNDPYHDTICEKQPSEPDNLPVMKAGVLELTAELHAWRTPETGQIAG